MTGQPTRRRRTAPRKKQPSAKTVEKWAQALNLRKGGASYDDIARQLGYSDGASAYNAVQSALGLAIAEPAEEVRKLELERLDRLQVAQWRAAMNGDVRAAQTVLKIMERRARLTGIDETHESDGSRLVELVEALEALRK